MSFRLFRTLAWTLDIRLIFIETVRLHQPNMNQQDLKTQQPVDGLINQRKKKIPPRWIKGISFETCNLSARRNTLWFISKSCLRFLFLLCVLNIGGNEYVKGREWAQAAWPQLMHHNGECAGFFFHANLPQTRGWGNAVLPCASCLCFRVFLVAFCTLCFQRDVSGRRRVQDSDGPQWFAHSSAEGMCLCPRSAGRGHVLTSLSARVSARCSISAQLCCT